MDILFFLLAVASIVALILGLIKPTLVIKWGDSSKRTRKNVLKYYGVGFILCFILFGVSITNNPTTSNSDGAKGNQQAEEPFKEEISKIEKNISETSKGKNYSISINDVDGKHIASITLDGGIRYHETVLCAIDALGVADSLKSYNSELNDKIDTYDFVFYADDLKKFNAELDNSSKANFSEIKLTSIETNTSSTVTRSDIDAYYVKQAEAEKAAKEKAAEEAKAAYATGITYKQLARTPDEYVGKKVMFTGDVIQVMEGDQETTLRIAVNGDYDSILLVNYVSSITSSRVLENDNITIRGVSCGLYTYESTLGGNITIPFVTVDMLTIN